MWPHSLGCCCPLLGCERSPPPPFLQVLSALLRRRSYRGKILRAVGFGLLANTLTVIINHKNINKC